MKSWYILAWRNLTANRLRTILSVLAVSFGVAATISNSVVTESASKAIITSDDLQTIMGGLTAQFDTMALFVSLVIMLAAGFLIFNAFAMSVTQRRQQIGALRSLGMTRGQIMRMMLMEAFIVGIIGVLLGLVSGPLMGRAFITVLRTLGEGLLAFAETNPATWSIIVAVGLGFGVTLLSMLFPARHASRISPLAALHEPDAASIDGGSNRKAWLGLIIIVLLWGHLIVAPPGTWVSFPVDANLSALFIILWIVGLVLILPTFISFAGTRSRRLLEKIAGATGRLIADNIQRGRRRVTLTILTLAFGLTVITGISGFINFALKDLFGATMEPTIEMDGLMVGRIDVTAGWEAITQLNTDSIFVSPEEQAAIIEIVGDRGYISETYFVVVPELSFLGDAYFSYVYDPDVASQIGDGAFKFNEGSWETALPVMQSGCGVLVAPIVAYKNNAGLGDTITVTGIDGPVECTIAGIGVSVAGASVISLTAGEDFGIEDPVLVQVVPRSSGSVDKIEADLMTMEDRFEYISVNRIEGMRQTQVQGADVIVLAFNGMLILVILAAALGVVNTTMLSVTERRKEILLLRSVGTTKRQVRTMILGEAALMGLIGGIFGFVAGMGFIVIFVVTYGGNSFGLTFPLWQTAFGALAPGLLTGVVGLISAPIIAALAAWLPTQGILREKLV